MKISNTLAFILGLFAASLTNGRSQNDLDFTGIYATPENAMQIHWASNTNEVYEIDYATSLIDTNTGTTTWQTLYEDYPSHGSNTFWLDTGDYNLDPAINHPKYDTERYYRIVLKSTDTAPVEPTVSITTPADGSTVHSNLLINVVAYSPDTIAAVKVYVDGQEMPASDDGTNFIINTCEWWNGQHVIFATAESVTHFEGIPGDTSIAYGHAVSSYVTLNFTNLITEVAFSQPYFEPSLLQTQQVTAYLTQNSDWTVQVKDINGSTVRTATGTGNNLVFNWDGTGTGGTNIPDGVYTFTISAQTNGAANEPISSGGSGGGSLPPVPMFSRFGGGDSTSYVDEDSGDIIPLSLFPPGFDTNGLTIFDASPSDMSALFASSSSFGSYASADSSSGGIAGQSTDTPVRPPTAKAKGTVGTFLVGYNTYDAAGGVFSTPPIPTGWPYPVTPQYVTLDGQANSTASHSELFGSILEHTQVADGFVKSMRAGAWKGSANPSITSSDVTGGTFNNYNVGFLCVHASYGTTAESDGAKRSYLRFFNNTTQGSSYCRLDDCHFGGAGTNGLKWMTILGCNVLQNADYNSLYTLGRLPMTQDLHELLSTASLASAAPKLGTYWAEKMLGQGTNAPLTVADSWFGAGHDAYDNSGGQGETNHLTFTFRVAYWPDKLADHLSDVAGSSGGNVLDIAKEDQVVFSNP